MGILPKSKAEKRYVNRILVTMSCYVMLVFGTTYLVRHEHVRGWMLYVCALLPSVPILRLLQVVGLYLKEETDEFVRQQVVNSLLWAMAVVLAVTAFVDFLRSYTPIGDTPPFTVFVTFWIVFALAQGVQSLMNRVASDD